jgi:hypothetical protein
VPETLVENIVASPKVQHSTADLYATDGVAFENIFMGGQKASSHAILKTLSTLRAYCVLAKDEAGNLASKGAQGAIPYLIQKFGTINFIDAVKPATSTGDAIVDQAARVVAHDENKDHPHENVVIEYARAMGEARKVAAYSAGIGKYMLDRIDMALMSGPENVEEYTGEGSGARRIRLSKKAMGLTDVPDIFNELSVKAEAFNVETVNVVQGASKVIDAAKIWIHDQEGKFEKYNSFTPAPTPAPRVECNTKPSTCKCTGVNSPYTHKGGKCVADSDTNPKEWCYVADATCASQTTSQGGDASQGYGFWSYDPCLPSCAGATTL